MNLIIKEQLSKLLATENINVEHANVTTAQFNLENRTLTLPNWSENVSNDIYDLLTSHEVGHALYTPVKELIDILLDKNYSNIKLFINVVEDSRIERKIKDTYPGLKKNYYNGYKELYDADFFKIKDVQIQELPLIDRLNLNEKIGNFSFINFSDTEKSFSQRIKQTKTFKDVVELSKELYIYSKEEQYLKSMQETVVQLNDFDGGNEDDFDGGNDGVEVLNKIEDLTKQIKKFVQEQQNGGSHGGDSEFSKFEPKVKTQENLEKSVEDITARVDKKLYLQLPKINYKNFIYDYKKVINIINNDPQPVDTKYLIQIKREVKKSVDYMIKIYESKKSASFYSRNKVTKTGTIDTSKLFSYKYSEDIFKKVSVVPEGKNHAMIILFDWSGSMLGGNKLYNCFKQLVSTVLFCKKMNIPFRVFLFGCHVWDDTPQNYNKTNIKYNNYDIISSEYNYKIVEILNSEMNKKEYDLVMGYFAQVTIRRRGVHFSFQGTPLIEACHTIDYMIGEFKKQYNVEICSLLVITDGINNSIDTYKYNNLHNMISNNLVFIRDTETKKLYKTDSPRVGMLQAKLNMIRDKHKCNVIGFFLGETAEINQIIYHYDKISTAIDTKKQLKTKKCATIRNCGYQEYHIVNILNIKDLVKIADAKSQKGLSTAFNKFLMSKNLNKIVISKFVETISKQVV